MWQRRVCSVVESDSSVKEERLEARWAWWVDWNQVVWDRLPPLVHRWFDIGRIISHMLIYQGLVKCSIHLDVWRIDYLSTSRSWLIFSTHPVFPPPARVKFNDRVNVINIIGDMRTKPSWGGYPELLNISKKVHENQLRTQLRNPYFPTSCTWTSLKEGGFMKQPLLLLNSSSVLPHRGELTFVPLSLPPLVIVLLSGARRDERNLTSTNRYLHIWTFLMCPSSFLDLCFLSLKFHSSSVAAL